MNIFLELKIQAAEELVQLAHQLPLQLTVMDIARFLGISRTTAYKLIHSEGFPAVQLPGFKRLIVPKKLFLDWYVSRLRENGYDIGILQDEPQQATPSANHAEPLAETAGKCYDDGV